VVRQSWLVSDRSLDEKKKTDHEAPWAVTVEVDKRRGKRSSRVLYIENVKFQEVGG
jgi:hypothetical protein